MCEAFLVQQPSCLCNLLLVCRRDIMCELLILIKYRTQSWTCVPNSHQVQFLAPAWEGDNTCLHWAERWEIRTRPLGCHVSTITTLTSLVTIACTLFFVFLVWLAGVAARRLVALHTKHAGWWKVCRLNGSWRQLRIFGPPVAGEHVERDQEHEPLLPSAQGAQSP